MKKFVAIIFALLFFSDLTFAQLERGNLLVGGDIAHFNLDLGGGSAFQATIDPKAAFFLNDHVALGAYLDFGLATAKGAGSTTNYGVGALGRYYIHDTTINMLKHGHLFFEANAGVQGVSISHGGNTTGLGIGIGPGYSYFITPNIGLEALLKYNGIVGFGSRPYSSNLGLGIGFQVYLSNDRANEIMNRVP